MSIHVFHVYVATAYFRPSLSYHLPLRALFCLFLSGHLGQVLLYILELFHANVKDGNRNQKRSPETESQ